VFVCNEAGTYPLTLVVGAGYSFYADQYLRAIPVFSVNGSITCSSPTARSGTNLRL
jgi:hypothetical protein